MNSRDGRHGRNVHFPFPGGHGNDGGYAMDEPSVTERREFTARLERSKDLLEAQVQAAERLIRAYNLSANYGAGTVLQHEIREAEAAYDAARNTARAALYLTAEG